jgi:hypothetical protein
MANINRDIFADANPVSATDDEIKAIGYLASKAIALKEEIDAMEEMLKERKREYALLTEKDLPEAMDAAQCGEFKHSESGKKIQIKDDVYASISKDNAPQAHQWLREHNHGDIIKNEIVVPLGRGLDNVAGDIINDIKTRYGIDAERKENVHAQTLKAFCREQLAAGAELPAALLGLFIKRVAVFK